MHPKYACWVRMFPNPSTKTNHSAKTIPRGDRERGMTVLSSLIRANEAPSRENEKPTCADAPQLRRLPPAMKPRGRAITRWRSTRARWRLPQGLALDREGAIVTAEYSNDRIVVMDRRGRHVPRIDGYRD